MPEGQKKIVHTVPVVAVETGEMDELVPGQNAVINQDGKPVAIDYTEFQSAEDLAAHIFSVPDIQEELVDIPEWKVQILVMGLTASERASILKADINQQTGNADLEKLYPDLVIASCYHPQSRQKIFKTTQRYDLNKKSGGVIERLALACIRLSGLDKQTQVQIRKN